MPVFNSLRTWIKLLALLVGCAPGVHCFATTIIYVANADSQDISVFQLDERSRNTKQLQTFLVGGTVMPMALSPDKQRLYAAIRSEPYRVLVLAIDPATGILNQKASVPLVDSMASISVDQQGKYLFAASYGGNKITAQRLDGNGIPQLPRQVLTTGVNPHQITSSSDNQFVYASLLGEDRLDYYQLKAPHKRISSHFLKPMPEAAVTLPDGSGPRHFVFSPDENFIYLLDELSANLHVLKRDTKTGAALLLESHALLQTDTKVRAWAADIHRTPDGQFLYASERTSSSLTGFKINKSDGRLTPIGRWDAELQPRAFAISPDGRFLAAVGQRSHSMTLYSIQPDTGELQVVNRQATGINPAWVEIVSLSDAALPNN